jgi:hypothetical protein
MTKFELQLHAEHSRDPLQSLAQLKLSSPGRPTATSAASASGMIAATLSGLQLLAPACARSRSIASVLLLCCADRQLTGERLAAEACQLLLQMFFTLFCILDRNFSKPCTVQVQA